MYQTNVGIGTSNRTPIVFASRVQLRGSFRNGGLRKGKVVVHTTEIATQTDIESLPLPEGGMGLPILGESVDFLKDPEGVLCKKMKMHGKIFKGHLFGRPTAFVNGTQNIRKAFLMVGLKLSVNESLSMIVNAWSGVNMVTGRGVMYRPSCKLLVEEPSLLKANPIATSQKLLGSNSLNLIDGPNHMFIRKLVLDSFNRSAVNSYVPKIVEKAQECLKKWSENDSIMFVDESKAFALGLVALSVIGLDYGEYSESDVLEIYSTWLSGFFSFGINLPFTKFRKAMNARTTLLQIVQKTVENCPVDKKGMAICRMLAARDENGNALNKEQLEDTIVLLLSAGFDTTSSAMQTLLLALNKHPEVLSKIRDEQRSIVTKFGQKITPEALDSMKYTEATVKEALRTRPVSPWVIRLADKTFELDGYRIPKDWQIFVGVGTNGRHYDERWGDDGTFNPDRFIEGDGKKPGGFSPFGIGAHSCLGNLIAMTEAKIVFALIARHYEFEVENPDPEINVFPIPCVADGLPVSFKAI